MGVWFRLVFMCESAGAGGFGSDWCLCESVLVGLVQTGVYVRECWCWWVWFRLVFM